MRSVIPFLFHLQIQQCVTDTEFLLRTNMLRGDVKGRGCAINTTELKSVAYFQELKLQIVIATIARFDFFI